MSRGLVKKTYSHEDPEKGDRQVGAREQSIHVERNNSSKYSWNTNDHFDHLLETFFSDW